MHVFETFRSAKLFSESVFFAYSFFHYIFKIVLRILQTLKTCNQFFLKRFMSPKRSHKFLVRTHKTGASTLNVDNHKKF